MSDARSIRSVSTSGTSYVPLEHTALKIVEELKVTQDKDAVYAKIYQNDDTGNILSHLFTNPNTRKDAWKYFDDNEEWCIQQMYHYSDPQLVALGYLCKKRPERTAEILARVCPFLKSKSTPLSVVARVDISLVDLQYVPDILNFLASEEYVDVSLAVVVIAKLLSERREALVPEVKTYFKGDPTATHLKVLGHLFSVDKALASAVFGGLEVDPTLYTQREAVVGCLEMLNAACIVKELRPQVASHPILAGARDSHDKDIKTLAAVVLAKLIASGTLTENPKSLLKDLDGYSILFENYLLENVTDQDSVSRTAILFSVIEAFAVTSALSSVRKRCDLPLLKVLCTVARANDAPWVYGALCAVANLVEYPFKLTAEERKVEEFKQKTGAQQALDVDTKLTPEEVQPIVEKLFETSLLNYLSSNASKLSIRSREQVCLILQSVAGHQASKIRTRLAKQGGVIISVYLWVDDKTPLDAKFKCIAGSVVSKVVTSVDPNDTFTHKFTPVAVLDPLRDQLNNPDSVRPNLDTFEALMALTNLASIENDKLNDLIVRKCWQKAEECLQAQFVLIQRGVFQLICNLSYCVSAADKLAARDSHGEYLRDALGRALKIDDLDAKLAASGALAILCEHVDMPALLGHNTAVMENLILSLDEDNEDLLLRSVTALHDIMVRSLKIDDDEAIEAVINFGGVPRIEAVVDRIDPHNIPLAGILARTVKLLVHFKLKQKVQ